MDTFPTQMSVTADATTGGGSTTTAVGLIAAGAGSAGSTVAVYTDSGTLSRTLSPFAASFTGGARVATADVTGDGTDDVIVGAGPGGGPQVSVYDGSTGSLLLSFFAFESTFTGGVYVAAGDLSGDGKAEVVVTPDEGGGPVVAVYSGSALAGGTAAQLARFYGITDDSFRGGARAALGDVNADGTADLVVAAGFGGGPRVAVFDGTTVTGTPAKLVNDFFVFEDTLRNGAFVARGDINADGAADLIAGGGPGGGPRVRVRVLSGSALAAGSTTTLADFFAGDSSLRGGVRVASADANGDGTADVVTGSGEGEASAVRVFYAATARAGTGAADKDIDPFGATLGGGVFVG